MNRQSGCWYEFGPFRLDPTRRRLLKGNEPVPLTPKTFDTLLVLVQCRDRTVSKDHLLKHVWAETVVEENNLTQAISRLRKALGESLDEHSYIVTVPGQGYRFVAPVHQVDIESESLAARLGKGPLSYAEAVHVLLAVLGDLERRHRQGAVHGRLTPTAILVSADGASLLEPPTDLRADSLDHVRYRAPEQIQGKPADARSDVFAAGAILFEMLAGRPAFMGESAADVERPIVSDTPPALGGSRGAAAVDRVIHRALAKKQHDRYPDARAMADALREALSAEQPSEPTRLHPVTRLIVLPFRTLRPDPDTDFLAFSLPDAITSSLSGLESLVVRSSLTAARFAGEAPDLQALASQVAVDMVLTGTLLREGDQLRINTQLVEVPGGAAIWSRVSQVPLGGFFQLQDDLTRRIVESLPVSLSARDTRLLQHDVPANARAYELYLHANQLAHDPSHWTVARDLYRSCLEADPHYAPAWARLARIYRVLALYAGDEAAEYYRLAEQAFRRALELNPDLPLAHNLYTYLEVELGGGREAMLRLIARARAGAGDPEIFAGLVHACRYCGLLDAAVSAYLHARRLDPDVRTSVAHAYWMLGEYEKAIESDQERPPLTMILALILGGREPEAVARLVEMEKLELPAPIHHYVVAVRGLLQNKRTEYLNACDVILSSVRVWDPCGRFYVARLLARVGDLERALLHLQGAVDGGFYCVSILARDPWLDGLRGLPGFSAIVAAADTRYRSARAAFLDAGGDRVLGLAMH